jgi:hypothetical protein
MIINVQKTMVFLFLLCIIFPALPFSGGVIRIPLVTFLVPFMLWSIYSRPVKAAAGPICFLMFCILASIIISIFWSGFKSEVFSIGEVFLYLIKFSILLFFLILALNRTIEAETILNILIAYLLFSIFIGALQWAGFSFVSRVYSISEEQFLLSEYDFIFRRIPSTAHMITAVGGLAIFSFISGVVLCTFGRTIYGCSLVGGGVLLAVFSQSRTAFVLIPMFLIFYSFFSLSNDTKLLRRQNSIRFFSIIFVTCMSAFLLIYFGDFLQYQISRFDQFGKQASQGENRVGQIFWAVNMISESIDNFLFGITNAGRTAYEGMFVEVEPVNIFLIYGLFGFFTHYFFIACILFYIYHGLKRFQRVLTETDLIVVSITFVSIIFYQVYSLSYFFFRDVYATYMIFALIGFSYGTLLRVEREHTFVGGLRS